MITFDEAYKSVETAIRDLEADVRISEFQQNIVL